MEPVGLAGLSVLIVEDEVLLRKQITGALERLDADVTSAANVSAASRFLEELSFDFVLLDVNLPDGKGTDLLRDKRIPVSTAVVVMTAEAGVEGAVEAMRLGAADYLAKPFDPAELPLLFRRVRRSRETARLNEHRRASESPEGFFFGAALSPLKSQLDRILAADRRVQERLAPVLIVGETGTGKTTIARWIHQNGPRASQALVEVNCSALPETLAESELFGHERGAFTDARGARLGLFEAANHGTLFLDELPSLSLPLQAKVLKVVEDGRIRRVGGNKEIGVDVRLVAATNQDLKQLIAAGRFREDLYHRLDLFRLTIAPLRERRSDLDSLADQLLEQICRRHRLPRRRLSAEGSTRLMRYAWPGNVRELAHELERAVVFEDGETVELRHLPSQTATLAAEPTSSAVWFNERFIFPPEGFSLEESINHLIQHALHQTEGNVSAAARLLGVSRDYVRYRLAGRRTEAPEGGE